MTASERSRRLWELAGRVAGTYRRDGVINRIGEKDLPSQAEIERVVERLLTLVFPGYHGDRIPRDADLQLFAAGHLEWLHTALAEVLEQTLRFSSRHGCSCAALWADPADPADPDDPAAAAAAAGPPAGACATDAASAGALPAAEIPRLASRLALDYLDHLPRIRATLRTDVEAAFTGDPAAQSHDEVILCYPGVLATAVHRLAHPLHRMGVPLVPRIMSEWAHQRTGVDIHPGARIGERFFIDHATGTVIGETTVIGDGVKLYQGVTLGALSFPRNPDGSLVKGGRRHPKVEDDVTIYAGATILGGETVIGRGAVIGGGAWITASVPAGAKVAGGRQGVSVAP